MALRAGVFVFLMLPFTNASPVAYTASADMATAAGLSGTGHVMSSVEETIAASKISAVMRRAQKDTPVLQRQEASRTQASQQTASGVTGAAIKAWSKQDQDTFGVQQLLTKNYNATLAPGLVLSQAIAMTVPNGGISVTVRATVLSNGTTTNEALTTTLALMLHVPAATFSRFEVHPTPYGTVDFHFYIGSSGTPTPAAGESKNNAELVLAVTVAVLAITLLLHASAVLVSRCRAPKAKNNDVELEQHKTSVAA